MIADALTKEPRAQMQAALDIMRDALRRISLPCAGESDLERAMRLTAATALRRADAILNETDDAAWRRACI